MKISNIPGEFGFKALVKYEQDFTYMLDHRVFFTLDAVKAAFGPNADIKWPVEVYEDGSVYVPAKEELENEY